MTDLSSIYEAVETLTFDDHGVTAKSPFLDDNPAEIVTHLKSLVNTASVLVVEPGVLSAVAESKTGTETVHTLLLQIHHSLCLLEVHLTDALSNNEGVQS